MTAAIGNIDDAILSLSISVRFLNEVIMKIARPVVLGAALALAAFDQAPAQDWPTRSVTVVVPIPAGVASDSIARAGYEQVGKQVGQTFVIENRPGAGGTIGANMVAKAEPAASLRIRNRPSPRLAKDRGIGRRGSARAGSQVVRIPGVEARPLDDGTSIGAV